MRRSSMAPLLLLFVALLCCAQQAVCFGTPLPPRNNNNKASTDKQASKGASPVLRHCVTHANSISEWIIGARRYLHRIPEASGHEYKTSDYIRSALQELGVEFKTGFGTSTGVVATIGSGAPTVLLRADMDALPIQEPDEHEIRSTHPGRMHACGHDAHVAMLLGAARLLQQQQQVLPGGLPGTVRLVFQPDEEMGAGGNIMINNGLLDGVDAAFALHVMPDIAAGVLATRKGTIMGGALSFRATVRGRGGHAAMPQTSVDPIVVVGSLISALQTLVSRETSPLSSGVISVTTLRAGDALNVIPDEASLGGTVRALDLDHLLQLQRRVEQMAATVASGYGCNASVDWLLEEGPMYPPTVNDDVLAKMTKKLIKGIFGNAGFKAAEPLMAAEDFAFYCHKVPCSMTFLGVRNEKIGAIYPLHSPRFTLDDSVLYKGAALHTAWAMAYLGQHPQPGRPKLEL